MFFSFALIDLSLQQRQRHQQKEDSLKVSEATAELYRSVHCSSAGPILASEKIGQMVLIVLSKSLLELDRQFTAVTEDRILSVGIPTCLVKAACVLY